MEEDENYIKKLRDGLAMLHSQAPEEVATILGSWDPSKPGNEIVTYWSAGRRFSAPLLRAALAWLTNTREADHDKKLKKVDVANKVLIALEALLPEVCGVCNQEYVTERTDAPSLRCSGCHTGFHEPCLESLGVGNIPDMPGKMLWLCKHCAPRFTVMTAVGGPKGASRPRASRRCAPVAPTPAASEGDTVGPLPDQQVTAETGEVEDIQGQGDTPSHSESSSATTIQEAGTSGVVCAAFMRGECRHGISGKKDGICLDIHPKRCPAYMKWGSKDDRGCSMVQETCSKAHPKLCPRSLELKCFDRDCPYKLHTFKCQRSRPPPRKLAGPNRGGQAAGTGHRDHQGAEADTRVIKTLGMATQAISIKVLETEVKVLTSSVVDIIVLHIRVVNRRPMAAPTVVLYNVAVLARVQVQVAMTLDVMSIVITGSPQ